MEHFLPSSFAMGLIDIVVVGAGGTGSQMVTALARLHHALIAFGHPYGLRVKLIDDDTVSETNLLRQAFYPCDLDQPKATVIMNRVNLGFGLRWESKVERITANSNIDADIIIGCVDTRAARLAIKSCGEARRVTYWLDCGNRLHDGQVILGEFDTPNKNRTSPRLPNAGDLYPELINPLLDETDATPSCSLAEALEKQSLFVNTAATLSASNLLFEFFRYGKLNHHGNFFNLKTGHTMPLAVDLDTWKRMGYTPE